MTDRDTDAGVKIRRATHADVEALAAMRRQLQHHSEHANAVLFTLSHERLQRLLELYVAVLSDSHACIVVAETAHHEQPIGMAMGRILRTDGLSPTESGRIDDVWVDPAYRRRGVCRGLVHALVDFFAHQHIEVLSLDYVVGNREAEATWQRYGFQPVLTVANGTLAMLQQLLARDRSR